MKPPKPKPAVKHSRSQKAHLRAVKRRSGPSAMRRKERRLHLQPKTDSEPDKGAA